MALSDMKVFNKALMMLAIETVAQEINKFNAASNGAILLSTEGFEGDYFRRSIYKSIKNAQRRVDRYQGNSAVTPTPIQQLEGVDVKVAGGATLGWEPSQFPWMQKDPATEIEFISLEVANLILQDQLNTVISAGVAAISNNPDTYLDGTAENINQLRLNQSHALFGDKSQSLKAQVMTGTAYHTLIGEALGNKESLFNSGTVTIVDILGKPAIITDSPALENLGATPWGYTMALAEGGLAVLNTTDVYSNIDEENGSERIKASLQVDYAFGVSVKGYAWDMVNGGKSPTDADIATGSNWDVFASDRKDTAGVILNYDPSVV